MFSSKKLYWVFPIPLFLQLSSFHLFHVQSNQKNLSFGKVLNSLLVLREICVRFHLLLIESRRKNQNRKLKGFSLPEQRTILKNKFCPEDRGYKIRWSRNYVTKSIEIIIWLSTAFVNSVLFCLHNLKTHSEWLFRLFLCYQSAVIRW